MFKSLFNKISKKPKFKGNLIALNDRVFDILRASEIGRGLLALNGDAAQRIYRSPYKNLVKEKSFNHSLANVAGYYLPDSDSILVSKSVRKKSVIDEAFVIAHELAHRLQDRHRKALKKKRKFVNGYERIMSTLLKEMHANNVADLVLMQAYQTFKDNGDEPALVIGIENHMRGRPVFKIANDNSRLRDITPTTSQNFFVDNFNSRLWALDEYIHGDLQRLTANQKVYLSKSQLSLVLAPASAISMGASLFFMGDAHSPSIIFGLQSAAFGGLSLLGYKLNKNRFNTTAFNESAIDSDALFERSGARILPTDQVGNYIQWAANDNQDDFLDHKVGMMKKRIVEVKQQGTLISLLSLTDKETRDDNPLSL